MVVLNGMSLKRKGAHEPGLLDDAGADDRSGFSLACRATKMRRLDGPRDGDGHGQAATPVWEGDVAMGEGDAAAAAPSPSSPGAVGDGDKRAVVVYGDGGGGSSSRRVDGPRLRADWLRAMLREADSRTVRELLAGAALDRGSHPDLALAVVPWVAPRSAAAAAKEEEAADGEDGAAAMDVEGDDKGLEQEGSRPSTWTGQVQAYGGAVVGEGLVYWWPQHCWAAPAPAVAQASPVMWSW